MIRPGRMWALVMRQWYLFPQSFDRITDAFLWPILDVILLGHLGLWAAETSGSPGVLTAIVTGSVFFRIMWHSSYEVAVNILEEGWNRNLTNLCSSPITKLEWLLGNTFIGLIKLVFIVIIQTITIWIFYTLNVFELGWIFVPYAACVTVFGWAIGFVASGFILLWGIRAQVFAWGLAFVISPLSATYYPVAVLPQWLQAFAYALPTTYVFEGMRLIIIEGRIEAGFLVKSILLNCFYLAGALWFFNAMFEKARQHGFDHLE